MHKKNVPRKQPCAAHFSYLPQPTGRKTYTKCKVPQMIFRKYGRDGARRSKIEYLCASKKRNFHETQFVYLYPRLRGHDRRLRPLRHRLLPAGAARPERILRNLGLDGAAVAHRKHDRAWVGTACRRAPLGPLRTSPAGCSCHSQPSSPPRPDASPPTP